MIQNDEILVIFQYLQAKLQRFRDSVTLFRIVQAVEKKFVCCSSRKTLPFMLLLFYDAAKAAKKQRLIKLKKHSESSSFTNLVAMKRVYWMQNTKLFEIKHAIIRLGCNLCQKHFFRLFVLRFLFLKINKKTKWLAKIKNSLQMFVERI